MKENKTTTFEKFNELVLMPYWVWLCRLSAVFCLVGSLTTSCGLTLTIMSILLMLLTWPSFFYQLYCFSVAVKEDSLLAGKYPHIRKHLGSQDEFIEQMEQKLKLDEAFAKVEDGVIKLEKKVLG